MAVPIEAYTGVGVLTGLVDVPGRLRDVIESLDELWITACRSIDLDGTLGERPECHLLTDDLFFVVPDAAEVPVHAAWHDVRLEVGPYVVVGLLPTQPGFDPGRALARPSGTFVLLRDAEIRALADPDRVLAEHGGLLVNRYVVDAVDAELMLGFFFPGARLTVRTSAGVDADPVAARAVGTPPGPDATGPAERRPGMLGSVGEGRSPS